jgi:hypothetical protein
VLVAVLVNKVKLSCVTPKSNIVAILINLALITSLRIRKLNKLRNLLLVKACYNLARIAALYYLTTRRLITGPSALALNTSLTVTTPVGSSLRR